MSNHLSDSPPLDNIAEEIGGSSEEKDDHEDMTQLTHSHPQTSGASSEHTPLLQQSRHEHLDETHSDDGDDGDFPHRIRRASDQRIEGRAHLTEGLFRRMSRVWVPIDVEDDNDTFLRNVGAPDHTRESGFITKSSHDRDQSKSVHLRSRNFRRKMFLMLTDPTSSFLSAIFFGILILAITLSNVIMILQTMEPWQFVPTDCITCGG